MSACTGSYKQAIRVNPTTHSAECPGCAMRFDKQDLAGTFKVNVPLHSPLHYALVKGAA